MSLNIMCGMIDEVFGQFTSTSLCPDPSILYTIFLVVLGSTNIVFIIFQILLCPVLTVSELSVLMKSSQANILHFGCSFRRCFNEIFSSVAFQTQFNHASSHAPRLSWETSRLWIDNFCMWWFLRKNLILLCNIKLIRIFLVWFVRKPYAAEKLQLAYSLRNQLFYYREL